MKLDFWSSDFPKLGWIINNLIKVVTNFGASSSGYIDTTKIRQKLGVKCSKAFLFPIKQKFQRVLV